MGEGGPPLFRRSISSYPPAKQFRATGLVPSAAPISKGVHTVRGLASFYLAQYIVTPISFTTTIGFSFD